MKGAEHYWNMPGVHMARGCNIGRFGGLNSDTAIVRRLVSRICDLFKKRLGGAGPDSKSFADSTGVQCIKGRKGSPSSEQQEPHT